MSLGSSPVASARFGAGPPGTWPGGLAPPPGPPPYVAHSVAMGQTLPPRGQAVGAANLQHHPFHQPVVPDVARHHSAGGWVAGQSGVAQAPKQSADSDESDVDVSKAQEEINFADI